MFTGYYNLLSLVDIATHFPDNISKILNISWMQLLGVMNNRANKQAKQFIFMHCPDVPVALLYWSGLLWQTVHEMEHVVQWRLDYPTCLVKWHNFGLYRMSEHSVQHEQDDVTISLWRRKTETVNWLFNANWSMYNFAIVRANYAVSRCGAGRWKRIVPKKRNVLWKQDDYFHGVPKFRAISSTSHENGHQCHFHVDMIKMFMTKINNQ